MPTNSRIRLGIPTPTSNLKQQKELLRTTKETLEIAQRQRGDPMKSFVRLEELRDLGLADQSGTLRASNATIATRRLRALIHFRGT